MRIQLAYFQDHGHILKEMKCDHFKIPLEATGKSIFFLFCNFGVSKLKICRKILT